MSTFSKDFGSRKGGPLDVKNVYPGHEGKSYHGFLLGGKYVSLREAGNILAGINAESHGQTFDDYMKGAGAYAQGGMGGAAVNKLSGATFGDQPYYGEQDYTGTRVKFGFDQGADLLK
jgi:filamentous hemagglutinin